VLSPEPRKFGTKRAARLTSLPWVIDWRRAGDTVTTSGIDWEEYPYLERTAPGRNSDNCSGLPAAALGLAKAKLLYADDRLKSACSMAEADTAVEALVDCIGRLSG